MGEFIVIKKYFEEKWMQAKYANEENILSALEENRNARLLSCGINDGVWTEKIAQKICIQNNMVIGIEIVDELLLKSYGKSFNVLKSDLNKDFPFRSNSFDVIVANQVIEHLQDVDSFIKELNRVLKSDGYCVISTENLSSIDNLIALSLGQQAFSQHISRKVHIGNILSPHKGESIGKGAAHQTVFTYFGLKSIFSYYGFNVCKIYGSGFFPLPNWLSRIDPNILIL